MTAPRTAKMFLMQWDLLDLKQSVAIEAVVRDNHCSMRIYLFDGNKRVMAGMSFLSPDDRNQWDETKRQLLKRVAFGWSKLYGDNTQKERDELFERLCNKVSSHFYYQGDVWHTYYIV